MYLTAYTSTPEPYFINHLALLHGKSPFEPSSGIHSTSVRYNNLLIMPDFLKDTMFFLITQIMANCVKALLELPHQVNPKKLNWKRLLKTAINKLERKISLLMLMKNPWKKDFWNISLLQNH